MMMSSKVKNIVILALVTGGVVFSVMSYLKSPKIAFVNTYQLYEQFGLKKELEDQLKKTQLTRQAVLDSIKAKIQLMGLNKVVNETEALVKIQEMKETYYIKEKQFMEDNQNQAQQYTDQVWTQLNQYIKDYGKEKGYDYILGANGQGGLMYADDKKDLSKEIIEYVNAKYQGAK